MKIAKDGLVAGELFTETGFFMLCRKVDIRPLAELFRASVLKILKVERHLDGSSIKKILTNLSLYCGEE